VARLAAKVALKVICSSSEKQDKMIKLAGAPSGAHIEEMSEDVEESELNDARDLNAAENAPTECLADH
jgi:hypothetical protein